MSFVRSYNSGVLVGNWWEDRILQQEQNECKFKHSESLKQVNGMLEKMGKEDVQSPQPMDGYLRFGSFVQIINPGASCYNEKVGISPHRDPYAVNLSIDNKVALSLLLHKKDTNILEELIKNDSINVTASPCCEPARRNIFQIVSNRDCQDGRLVRYGQPILLALHPKVPTGDETKETGLFLASDFERLGDPVYLPGAQPLFFEMDQPTFLSHWILIAEHPFLRAEFDGTPVRCDDRLLIKHVRTNKALALETKFGKKTLFGNELCLSANTYFDSHKLERDVNIWTLTTAKQVGISKVPDCQINQEAPHLTAENTSLECDTAHRSVRVSDIVSECQV